MRNTLLALAAPVFMIAAAASLTLVPLATAEGTYTVAGTVLSDTGEPLAGVRVNGYTHHDGDSAEGSSLRPTQLNEATTDADGHYTLQLAPGKGYVSIWYDEWRIGDGRDIALDSNRTDLDFTLKTPPPKTAVVSGRILDAAGNPIAGATVSLQRSCCYAMPAAEPMSVEPTAESDDTVGSKPASTRIAPPYDGYDDQQTATTREDGQYSFKSYAGPRQVTAFAKGYAQTSVPVEAIENEEVRADVTLLKVPARDAILTGRVIDSTTGAPLAGAHVSARSLEWGRWAEATTGADGTYRLQTVPGWTEISLNYWGSDPVALAVEPGADLRMPAPRGKSYYPFATLIALDSGDNALDAKLEAKAQPTIALIGYVVDPASKTGIPGAQVSVWNQENGDWGEATTDATGSFRILVSAGHYSANAWKEGHLSGQQTFRVDESATQRLDILLPKGVSRWAPCTDESDCGGIYYAEARSSSAGEGMDGSIAPPAPEGAPSRQTMTASSDAGGSNVPTDGADKSRAAAYQGEGGGLPPYEASSPGGTSAREGPSAAANVPGLGILASIGALAVVAAARRFTKN